MTATTPFVAEAISDCGAMSSRRGPCDIEKSMSNDKDASNCADIDPRTLLNRVAQLESKSVDVLLVQVYRSFKQLEINAYNTFSVFSYLRTLTTWHCPPPHVAAAAFDRYLLLAGPTTNPPLAATAGEWARQTDGHRTVSHTMRAVPINYRSPNCRLPQMDPRDALSHAHRVVHRGGRSV